MLGDTLKLAGFVLVAFLALAQVAAKISRDPPRIQSPVAAAPSPAPAPARVAAPVAARPVSALDDYFIPVGAGGQYFTKAQLNGQSVDMVVDTGARSLALRNEDAATLGIFPLPSDFSIPISTANGVGHAAHVKLSEVQIGSIVLYDVDAIVCQPGALKISLLGMTFLSRLSKVEIQSGSLLLRR